MLAYAMRNQVNQGLVVPPNVAALILGVRDFTIMNSFEFHKHKIDENLQDFIDGVHKFISVIGVP